MRRASPLAGLVLAALALAATRAEAAGFGQYRFDPRGKVKAVRAADVDRDGRLDLVVLVETQKGDAPPATEILVLRSPKDPKAPTPKTYFAEADAVRLLRGAGYPADAGAVCVGRFGEKGALPLRFFTAAGGVDCSPAGCNAPAEGPDAPHSWTPATLLRGGPGTPPVVWDLIADLDGDGTDESWFPGADARVVVHGSAKGHIDLSVSEEGARNERDVLRRTVRAPSLAAADLDGDGRKELLGVSGTDLVVHRYAEGAWKRDRTVVLPFLAPDPDRPAEEIRTPRINVLDADADGKADLLVTLVHGRADQVGGLRTSLYHFAGPFWNDKGALASPRTKLDTESVALHPRFVDVNGDGRLDYVADSIRGNVFDLIQRVMGKEPEITFTVFLFDPATGTYEPSPYATLARPFSGAQARSNVFGQSGWFDGDFDGDGHKDLLDLGNLDGVTILRGKEGGSVASGGRASFDETLMKRATVTPPFASDAVVADLNADGRSDAVLWNETAIYLLVSR